MIRVVCPECGGRGGSYQRCMVDPEDVEWWDCDCCGGAGEVWISEPKRIEPDVPEDTEVVDEYEDYVMDWDYWRDMERLRQEREDDRRYYEQCGVHLP